MTLERSRAADRHRPARRARLGRAGHDGVTEETPYHFARAAQLTSPSRRAASCRPNRGREGSPLFLLNHWITTAPVPRPSDAAKVNAYGPLLARARACGRIRRHAVTVVAVSFYRRGDVVRVVDTLNGVRRAREPPAGAPVH